MYNFIISQVVKVWGSFDCNNPRLGSSALGGKLSIRGSNFWTTFMRTHTRDSGTGSDINEAQIFGCAKSNLRQTHSHLNSEFICRVKYMSYVKQTYVSSFQLILDHELPLIIGRICIPHMCYCFSSCHILPWSVFTIFLVLQERHPNPICPSSKQCFLSLIPI